MMTLYNTQPPIELHRSILSNLDKYRFGEISSHMNNHIRNLMHVGDLFATGYVVLDKMKELTQNERKSEN